MTTTMSKNLDQVILQLYARTPAPCRDYCGLTITNEEVILNVWNITFGPHVYPKRYKCALENLIENKFIQSEISRVFGEHVVDYVKSLSNNELKLENLSTKAFLSVLKYVAAKDILSLSQASKILFERCNDDKIWSLMFRKLFKKSPTQQDLLEVEEVGWKRHILEKLTSASFKRVKKKIIVSGSKSVNGMEFNNKVKSDLKSDTNLTLEKHLNNNQNNYSNTQKTLLQVKNDLKLSNSNLVKSRLTKQGPRNNTSNLTTPRQTNKKTAIKKVLENEIINQLLGKNTENKAAVKKFDNKSAEKKVDVKPIEKKIVKQK